MSIKKLGFFKFEYINVRCNAWALLIRTQLSWSMLL